MSVMWRKFPLTEVVMLSNPATRHHQMPGRSWRAGQPCGDGKPEGPDRPLEKGVGGIEIDHQMPAEEQRSGGHALWCARRP